MTPLLRLLCFLVACGVGLVARAEPVIYTFHFIASGTLAGAQFDHLPLRVQVFADSATTQADTANHVSRTPAATTAVRLGDNWDIGPFQRPLGVSARCVPAPTGYPTVTIGIDIATTALPAVDMIVAGEGSSASCGGFVYPVTIENATPSLGTFVDVPTSAGALTLTSIASVAVAIEVIPIPELDLRVLSNPYGSLTVTGGTFDGTRIVAANDDVVIQLGSGTSVAPLQLERAALVVGAGRKVTFRAGAPGQSISISPLMIPGLRASSISGQFVMEGSAGAPAPMLTLYSSIDVHVGGEILAPSGARLITPYYTYSGAIFNLGMIDGGPDLRMNSPRITGGGVYRGDRVIVWTTGAANNPVAGRYYLANGIAVAPSTAGEVELVLRSGRSDHPSVFNVVALGDALVSMQSTWPSGADPAAFGSNNLPVLPHYTPWPGYVEPPYGGGSLIVQATGALRLDNRGSRDFVFPGGIVLRSAGELDLAGAAVIQGWSTSGQPFQGIFVESPSIVSRAGPATFYGNDLNWVNFSTRPQASLRTFTLKSDGSAASYVGSDATAPHLNTYSAVTEVAAKGGCWTCIVDTKPLDVTP